MPTIFDEPGFIANLKLLTTQGEFNAMVAEALAPQLNERILKQTSRINGRVSEVLKKRLMGSPEYKSLMGEDQSSSSLRGHFGLIAPVVVVTPIINTWLASIIVTLNHFKPTKSGKLNGGLKITAIQGDYKDVENLPYSSYTAKPSGKLIEWLKWLLESGTQVLIQDYGITFDIDEGGFVGKIFRSRSGEALMISPEVTFGMKPLNSVFQWSVPPEYAGTQENNWVTRALIGIEKDIENIFITLFD